MTRQRLSSDSSSSANLLNKARGLLLAQVVEHCDCAIAEPLKAATTLPYPCEESDIPQLNALKRIFNCLYVAEQVFLAKEEDATTKHKGITGFFTRGIEKVKEVAQTMGNIKDLHQSFQDLERFLPHIHGLISSNYQWLQPHLFEAIHQLEQLPEWAEFEAMSPLDKASLLSTGAKDFFGTSSENTTLPAVLEKLTRLVTTLAELQRQELNVTNRNNLIEKACLLLADLDQNPFFHQFRVKQSDYAQGWQQLGKWLDSLKNNGFLCSKDAFTQYAQWNNTYLPQLLQHLDDLEQQNYLKHGSLSNSFCIALDGFIDEVNQHMNTPGLMHRTEEHKEARWVALEKRQQESLRVIDNIAKKQRDANEFFDLLLSYRGKKLSAISMDKRERLGKLLQSLADVLAQQNVMVTNQLIAFLNNPESEQTTHVLTQFSTSSTCSTLLLTQTAVNESISIEKRAEEFKILRFEAAKAALGVTQAPLLMPAQADQLVHEKTESTQIIEPVKESSLKTFRGYVAKLREMQLSQKLVELEQLLHGLLEKNQFYFNSSPPYALLDGDSSDLQNIKQMYNVLYHLQKLTDRVEHLDNAAEIILHGVNHETQANTGLIGKISTASEVIRHGSENLEQIKECFSELSASLTLLSEAKKEHFEPIIRELTACKKALKGLIFGHEPVETGSYLGFSIENTHPALVVLAENPRRLTPQIEILSKTRTALTQRIMTQGSPSIKRYLKLQPADAPFSLDPKDPPEAAAIKQLLLAIYHAEQSLDHWQKQARSRPTRMDKIVYLHQALAAFAEVYKVLDLLYATADIQELIANHIDLLEPLFKEMTQLMVEHGLIKHPAKTVEGLVEKKKPAKKDPAQSVEKLGLKKQFAENAETFKVGVVRFGSTLGGIVQFMEPAKQDNPVIPIPVQIAASLPDKMHRIADRILPETSKGHLQHLTDAKIESIASIFNFLVKEQGFFETIGDLPQGITSILELLKAIKTEKNEHLDAVIATYDKWMHQHYADILQKLDTIETTHHLNPGCLVDSISEEMDEISRKLNELIVSRKLALVSIPLSEDSGLKEQRLLHLEEAQYLHAKERLDIEDQLAKLATLDQALHALGQSRICDLPVEILSNLASLFASIQKPLALMDLELANQMVTLLVPGADFDSTQVLNQALDFRQWLSAVDQCQTLLMKKIRSMDLKTESLTLAKQHIAGTSKPLSLPLPAETRNKLDALLQRTAGPLKPIAASSLHNMRGHIALLKESKLSHQVGLLYNFWTELRTEAISSHLNEFLSDRDNFGLQHIIQSEPHLVTQLKYIENSFIDLKAALTIFEDLEAGQSYVFQMKAFLTILRQLWQTLEYVATLPPQLKSHFKPIVTHLSNLYSTLKSIEYNRADWSELKLLLQGTKKEILKLKEQREHAKPLDPNLPQDGLELGQRAAKLATKYLFLAPLSLDECALGLNTIYQLIHSPLRPKFELSAEEQQVNTVYAQAEIDRLSYSLNHIFGLNINTVNVIHDIAIQLMQVQKATNRVLDLGHEVLMDDYAQVKAMLYRKIVVALSDQEDKLGLRPGSLLQPVYRLMDDFVIALLMASKPMDSSLSGEQILHNAAFAQGVSFSQMVNLREDSHFIQIILEENRRQLEVLRHEPSTPEIVLKIQLLTDKRFYLQSLHAQMIKENTSPEYLEAQRAHLQACYFVYVRDKHCSEFRFSSKAIKKQYQNDLESICEWYKKSYKKEGKSTDEMLDSMQRYLAWGMEDYKRSQEKNYKLVDQICHWLSILPEAEENFSEELGVLLGDESIERKATFTLNLPKNEAFMARLKALDTELNWALRFLQFLKLVVESLFESLMTHELVVDIYKQKTMVQTFKNIEQQLFFAPAMEKESEDEEVEADSDVEVATP